MILFASSMVSVSSGRLFLIVPGEAAARHASGVAGAYQLIVIADLLLDEHMFKGSHSSPKFLQFCSAAGFPRMSSRFFSGPHLARLPGCLLVCRHETPPFSGHRLCRKPSVRTRRIGCKASHTALTPPEAT